MTLRAVLTLSGLLASASVWAASELTVLRVDGSASSVRADATRPLMPRGMVLDGDLLRLPPGSRVALQLAGTGLISLARGAELQVYDSRRGSPSVGRFKLTSGSVRVDSRSGSGRPAQDIRLNVGSLKARIYGAEVLGANDAAGETLCLLAGALEVQTAGAPDSRLDQPGACLRRTPDGQLSRLRLDTDAHMGIALAATEFAEPALAEAAGTGKRSPSATPIIAASSPPAESGPAKPGSWTVVVLSLAKREAVDARTQSLLDQGLPAVTRSVEVKGQTMYRVTVGEFPDQPQARAYAKNTLVRAGIEGWLSPL